MVIVTGLIEVNSDKIEQACAAVTAMMDETRKEPGCIVYEFSQLVEASHKFRVYEEWDDMASLAVHGQTTHMATFRDALSDIGVTSRAIFTVENGIKKLLG